MYCGSMNDRRMGWWTTMGEGIDESLYRRMKDSMQIVNTTDPKFTKCI